MTEQTKTECTFAGCDRPRRYANIGLCNGHYEQRRNGRTLAPLSVMIPGGAKGICVFPDCGRPRRAKELCGGHYRMHNAGLPLVPVQVRNPGEWGPWKPDGNHGYIVRQRHTRGDRATQLQHRFVMEQYLGRPLLPHENVHHKNGCRGDNRLENLELWSTHQPKGQRVEDKVAGPGRSLRFTRRTTDDLLMR